MSMDDLHCIYLMKKFLKEVDDKTKRYDKDIQLNTPITSLLFFPKTLIYNHKRVKKISLTGYFLNYGAVSKDRDSLFATRVLLEFNDDTHSVLQFKASDDLESFYPHVLYKAFSSVGEECYQKAFLLHGKMGVNKKKWASETLPYDFLIRTIYLKIHCAFSEAVIKNIEENSSYLRQAKNKGVYVISLGCGDGKDLEACCERLRAAGFENSGIGFDSSKELIEGNKKRNTPYQFEIVNVLEMYDKLNSLVTDDKLVMVIASGIINRLVLDGTRPAQEVLEQLSVWKKAKIIIAGGGTDLLITHSGAESAGWDLKPFDYKDETRGVDNFVTQLFVCHRQSDEKEFSAMLARSRARSKDPKIFSTLDLSMTACPLNHMQNFLEKESLRVSEITQIDLSWSQVSSKEISSLLKLFSEFKNLTHVTISCYEPWADEFKKELTKILGSVSFKLLRRKDSTCANELPTISVPDCKRLGIYKTLPNETILEGTARGEYKETKAAVFHLPGEVSLSASKETLFSLPGDREVVSGLPQIEQANEKDIKKAAGLGSSTL